MSERPDERVLRLALRANASFSSVCALLFIFDSESTSTWTGAPGALLVALGMGLLGFAALLVTTSLRSDPMRLRREGRIHCAADLVWVAGSVPVIAFGWLTPTGSVALAGVSAVVFALAMAQWHGIGGRSASSNARCRGAVSETRQAGRAGPKSPLS
jgi:hypothetical protein